MSVYKVRQDCEFDLQYQIMKSSFKDGKSSFDTRKKNLKQVKINYYPVIYSNYCPHFGNMFWQLYPPDFFRCLLELVIFQVF